LAHGDVSDILIVTCSMRRDLPLFALLARSIDDCVASRARHRVIVPSGDIAAFAPFANARREIVAQEDVLPFRTLRLPAVPDLVVPLVPALRRPLYLDAGLRPLRGWILQQLLKIEATRRAREPVVMHVDSDVAFFRSIPQDAVEADGRIRLFRAGDRAAPPLQPHWADVAARLLGTPDAATCGWHYVENCVVWAPPVVQAMAERIEAVCGRSWHEALRRERSFSEYSLYGLFADLVLRDAPLTPGDIGPCRSWFGHGDAPPDLDALLGGVLPHHCAIAVQSTNAVTAEDRAAHRQAARIRFGTSA
jgi:hypothetical protein